jgi:multiple sugar transport system permease protein
VFTKIKNYVLLFILIIFAIYSVAPILWVFVTSFKTKDEAMQFPPKIIPQKVTMENYLHVFKNKEMMGSFWNSLIVSIGSTLLCVLVSALTAFSFSRYRYKGKAAFMSIIMGLFMVPVIMNLIPLYLMFGKIGLLDSKFGLIIVYQIIIIPLNIFILKAHFDTIPEALEEAAIIDGCGVLGRLKNIIIPVSWPGLTISFIFSFRFAWNEFALPLVFISSPDKMVFQVAIYRFLGLHAISWGYLTASIVVGMIPVIIIITFFQKQLLAGLTAGAVKG